jgi:hypothetical protein
MTVTEESPPTRRLEEAYAYANLSPWSWRARLFVIAASLAVLLVVAAVYVWHHYKLAALDDYRSGHALGSLWRLEEEAERDCKKSGTLLYGANTMESPRSPGYPAFVAGCQDGLRGEPAVSWWDLRSRYVSSGY